VPSAHPLRTNWCDGKYGALCRSRPAAFGGGSSHTQAFQEGKAKALHKEEAKGNTAGSFPLLRQPAPAPQQAVLRGACCLHRQVPAPCQHQSADNDVRHRS